MKKIARKLSGATVVASALAVLSSAALAADLAISGGIVDYPISGPLSTSPAAVAQYSTALALVKKDPRLLGVFNSQCNLGPKKEEFLTEIRKRANANPAPASKVMDNLYFFAKGYVSAWAVTTPDGIIMIDALNREEDIKDVVIPGMQKLGLDPAQIKYVVVLHEHGDHYGGAKYLQDTYKARVYASQVAWDGMAKIRADQLSGAITNWKVIPPTKDGVITDGMKLSLGGETITFYLTPGHTKGTVSALIPVTDKGAPHLAADWGGTNVADESQALYTSNLERFRDIAMKAGADMVVSSHQHVMTRASNAFTPPASGASPLIIGETAYRDYTDVHLACLRWYAARLAAGEKLRTVR